MEPKLMELDAELSFDRDQAETPSNLLQRALAAGARPAAELQTLVKVAGYSWRTLQDATVRLNIRRAKSGMQGGWIWALPPEQVTPEGTSEGTSPRDAAPHGADPQPLLVLQAYRFAVPDGPSGIMYGTPCIE